MEKQISTVKLDQRVDLVCSNITYEIATGVFQPEAKLPTVREAVARWNVDHRIVLKAYKRLEEMGLIRSVPRSGYYVAIGEANDLISRNRFELESMFERLSGEISKTTGLSVLGALRYLAQLAEIRSRDNPECAFLECTMIQASGHAAEVKESLSIPCLPMTIEQVAGKVSRIPENVRTVLATGFHYGELGTLKKSKRFNLLSVPIEVSSELTRPAKKREETVVFESDESQGQHMAQDIEKISRVRVCRLEITSDIDKALADTFGNKKRKSNVQAFLSPRLWGRVDSKWRNHENVRLIEFRITQSAWPSIANAIGLPLGTIPSGRN